MLRSLGPYDIQIMGQLEDRIVLPISNFPQMEAVLITTFVLPNTSETSPDGRMLVAHAVGRIFSAQVDAESAR